jgi:hypothetical protein
MTRKNIKQMCTWTLLSLALAAPVVTAEARADTEPAGSTATSAAPLGHRGAAPGTRAEEQRYAKKAAASPDAKKFRGGDVVVISASALAIILAVVLIIVLI